ncbi:MAG: lytic transglycosylase domain-containing protein [Clostridiales bacterium]|nr:lytic transglycosylase domain-containing protein [Clostridiales bacterium]
MKIKFLSVCGAVLCILFALIIAVDVVFPLRYYGYVKKYCSEYDVEPSIALAVIWTESKFRPQAVSSAGARGLMQLMPSTAEWLSSMLGEEYSDEKLFEPEYNIRLGIFYFSYLQQSFEGDYVLAAYNAGEGNVRKWLAGDGEIKFAETQDYIKKVNLVKKIYKFRVGYFFEKK